MRPNSRYTVPAKRTIPGIDNTNLTVIIAAASIGKRMKSYGPKALFEIHEEYLLEKQLHTIWSVFPNVEIIVVVGFAGNKIRNKLLKKKYPIRFVLNPLYQTTNVMFSLSLGLYPIITGGVLMMHGDLMFNTESIYGITAKGSRVLVDVSDQFDKDEVGIIYDHETNIVTNFAYGLPIKWGQMAYLEEKELRAFERIAHNHELSQTWFFYEGLNRIVELKGKLHTHVPVGMRIVEIDSVKDLEKARSL